MWYFNLLLSFFNKFFNGVCYLFIIAQSISCEDNGHYLCQIIECLNHVHLCAIGGFNPSIEVLNLFMQNFVLRFQSFILQHQVCGIDTINGFCEHFFQFFYWFCHGFMTWKTILFHPYVSNKRIASSFLKILNICWLIVALGVSPNVVWLCICIIPYYA
jgi:hypothetical protein